MSERLKKIIFPRRLVSQIEDRLQKERARVDHKIDSLDELRKRDPLQVLAIVASTLERNGSGKIAASTVLAAYQICQGAIVCSTGAIDDDDALIVAALCRAALGHRVQLIVSDGVDFSKHYQRLNQTGKILGLTVASIDARNAEDQRRQAYRASIVICPLLTILKDRTRDLLQWPLKTTAAQRQFDRLYGRRSAARNRLLPDRASAVVYQADRVLIDQLALKITVGETTTVGKSNAAGAVHALSLFKSYDWIGGMAGPNTSSMGDIRKLYGVRVVAGKSTPKYGRVTRDVDTQAQSIADVVNRHLNCRVHIEVPQDALMQSLNRCFAERNIGCLGEPGSEAIVTAYRERQQLEDRLTHLDGERVVIITTSLDPAPGSVRRMQAGLDPNNRHRWLAIYSLDEALLARRVPAVFLNLTKLMWHPALSRLLEPLVANLAAREERQQRLAFVESLSVHRRRFAFAPQWDHSYD